MAVNEIFVEKYLSTRWVGMDIDDNVGPPAMDKTMQGLGFGGGKHLVVTIEVNSADVGALFELSSVRVEVGHDR
jgi:hypothetical protein